MVERLVLSRARGSIVVASFVTIIAVAFIDARVDPHIRMEVFYILPVMAAGWFGGRHWGVAAAAVAALGSGIGDVSGGPSSQRADSIWNAVGSFLVFALVAILAEGLRRMLREHQALATVDPLTGLLNRRAFEVAALTELARARRTQLPYSMAYVDLDGLKGLNDHGGHAAGDVAIVRVAEAARKSVRSTDLVARLGGDEFGLLFPESDQASAQAVTARLMAALADQTVDPPLSVSIGLVTATDTDVPLDQVIAAADRVMYEAKAAGGGTLRTAVLTSRADD